MRDAGHGHTVDIDDQPQRAQPPTGMRDIAGADAAARRQILDRFAATMGAAGFDEVVLPVVEDVSVFSRISNGGDIVTKEMYVFDDPAGRRLALRPEQTAGVCRCYVTSGRVGVWKAWYAGPNFRYEKPQRGRYRQFDQAGAELLGASDPCADADMIVTAARFLEACGLTSYTLRINSLGDPADRDAYTLALAGWASRRREQLSERAQATLDRNPLRLLDVADPADREILADAPRISEFWSPDAAAAFTTVRAVLDRAGVTYIVDPTLVRGLDYYQRTTFEFAADQLDAAQNAVAGGGRYGGLVEAFGGDPTPGVGFAVGVDRLALAIGTPTPPEALDVYVVDLTGGIEGSVLAAELRACGLTVDRVYEPASMRSALRAANRSGARTAVIVGANELAEGTVTVKDMTASTQMTVDRAAAAAVVSAACRQR